MLYCLLALSYLMSRPAVNELPLLALEGMKLRLCHSCNALKTLHVGRDVLPMFVSCGHQGQDLTLFFFYQNAKAYNIPATLAACRTATPR